MLRFFVCPGNGESPKKKKWQKQLKKNIGEKIYGDWRPPQEVWSSFILFIRKSYLL